MEQSEYAMAVHAVEGLCSDAKAQEFANLGAIGLIWTRFQRDLAAATQRDPRLWPTPTEIAAGQARATAIAREAADELRALMAVPREDREEAWARANGKPSPKAERENALARIRIQHERDTKAQEDAKLDPLEYLARLMKRKIVVHVSEDGRLWARGPLTDEDRGTLANKLHQIVTAIGRKGGEEIRQPIRGM